MDLLQWCCVTASLIMSVLLQVMHGCTDRDVKYALDRCNPLLSTISTMILATTDGDYTNVCWVFRKYIVCVEPHTLSCQSLLMKRYWVNKVTYSSQPYNCSIPTISKAMYKPEQSENIVHSACTDHTVHVLLLTGVTLTSLLLYPT
ncbi:hypothetical protein LSAT2_030956 [Lamellibrachia satsuma]|nr:hypothetical protein LSAT2_030956 [Lamellibrachia satsuma]